MMKHSYSVKPYAQAWKPALRFVLTPNGVDGFCMVLQEPNHKRVLEDGEDAHDTVAKRNKFGENGTTAPAIDEDSDVCVMDSD